VEAKPVPLATFRVLLLLVQLRNLKKFEGATTTLHVQLLTSNIKKNSGSIASPLEEKFGLHISDGQIKFGAQVLWAKKFGTAIL
jgi:hypothetical protein